VISLMRRGVVLAAWSPWLVLLKCRTIHRLAATVALTLIVCVGVDVVALNAFADVGTGLWRVTGSLLGGHSDEKVVTLANGRVLVMYVEDEEVTPDHPTFTEGLATELYEPDSGTWIPGPAPLARNASTIVPLTDGGALLLGESACGGGRCLPTSATYRLDASDSAWMSSTSMREARARPTVVQLADGRVLVAGGFGDSCTPRIAFGYSCASLSSVEIFDPATGVWSPTAPMPTPRGGASATLLSDGTVLLVGGSSQTDDVLRYNPASERWTTLGPSLSLLTGSKLLSLAGDRAIALGSEPEADFYGSYGGAGDRPHVICNSIPEIFTSAHNAWTIAPPLPEESISCSTNAALLTNGQILYAEKAHYGEARYGARYVLDPHQQCWAATGAPVTQHEGILAALRDGGALDPGQTVNEGEPFTGAEIYTSSPQTCSPAQQLRTSIFTRMVPQGTATNIATVLATGYYFSLKAIRPGRLTVDWYYTRKENEGRPGPVIVGAGRASSARGGSLRLALKLTASGKRLLARSSQLLLAAKVSFTTKGGETVTATRPFTLSR
jgi:Kelch motif/Galactose oxidase, central domain